MRENSIYLFNYSARDFPFQLAQELSQFGWRTEYSFCSDLEWNYSHIESAPNNKLFHLKPMNSLIKPRKDVLIKRLVAEIFFGLRSGYHFMRSKRGLLVICDVPLIVAFISSVLGFKHSQIIWHQDLWSTGMSKTLKHSRLINFYRRVFTLMEVFLLKKSKHIIAIDDQFLPFYDQHGISRERVSVISNWAPALMSKSSKPQFERSPIIVYAGTLGLKHDLNLLVSLSQNLEERLPGFKFILNVNTSAVKMLSDRLACQVNTTLQEHVDKSELEALLIKSKFGLTILSEESSEYSIPSKVFTYLVHGLIPIGLMPLTNSSASTILQNGGAVFTPDKNGLDKLIYWLKAAELNAPTSFRQNKPSESEASKRTELFHKIFRMVV